MNRIAGPSAIFRSREHAMTKIITPAVSTVSDTEPVAAVLRSPGRDVGNCSHQVR
jgi:hypothetical protein